MMLYSTYTWDLVRDLESTSPASARHQPHLLIQSAYKINQKKAKNPVIKFKSPGIVPTGLTQNPGLREVDLEPSLKTGSDKINMQKQARNTQKKASHIIQPGLIYEYSST